ncbi:MAG: hypothetical protein JXM70_01105 [Pirellulales bacterium]|nr:hypothetical protein [Pirellulales bacterium]
MKKPIRQIITVVAVLIVVVSTAESSDPQTTATEKIELDKLVGKPVDISPWAYAWRADRAVQEKPEAYFIPRRLERLDNVYRTAIVALPVEKLKSIYYPMPDLLIPLLPKPKGQLQAGLLWTGGIANPQVELRWPAGTGKIPAPETVEVRVYPTSFGWFGWTRDRILSKPQISKDGLNWTYKDDPAAKMLAVTYAGPLKSNPTMISTDAATELVAVFYDEEKTPGSAKSAVPSIRVTSPNTGVWQRMDLEIEWGFQPESEKVDWDGCVESYMAMVGPVTPLANDNGTKVTGTHTWQSRAEGNARRGIVVPLLYATGNRAALDSRVTVLSKTASFTFRVRDLENGPILIPEHGVFVTKAGSGKTARQFAAELAAKNLKSICQMVREHPEAASWDELMQKVRLSTCPAGTAVPPFPQVPDPPMQVQLPDQRWTDAWRAASFQLKGRSVWGGLAFEVARVAHDMDMVGLHDEANKVYEHFLKAPGAKSDGDYVDCAGALEWATGMRHDMGYDHDGTHASTGRLLFAMAERYFLTGDKQWFERNRARMQAAADWIIRQRNSYMKDIPNRQDLMVAGLMPPCMLGDYAMPSCDWHWYYCDNTFALQGLQRFADALTEFDADTGRNYRDEANAFRKDIRRAVEREAALSPVRLGRDGMYHSYIPQVAAYARGAANFELGAPQRPQIDTIIGALPLAEQFAALDANDSRIAGSISAMEELGTAGGAMQKLDGDWFWNCYGGTLPKASHNANIYLLQDDVPNFLRFWMNSYAAMVSADGKLWEWGCLGAYNNCTWADNGTAGWFLENFRNLLVMEDGQSLWIARATPRVWLEQGKKIVVKNAPTYFGTLAYEILSDVDNGKITATVEIPNRNPPKSVVVRFRHPKAAPIKNVTVNGQPWTGFDKDKETIKLTGFTGKVEITANY